MSDRVPARFVRTLLRMVEDEGYDFSTILTDAGLDFNPLDEDSSNYRAEVSAMQYSRVYQHVLHLLQDETFGAIGNGMAAPGGFRMMCYCVISCDNLGKAIKRTSELLALRLPPSELPIVGRILSIQLIMISYMNLVPCQTLYLIYRLTHIAYKRNLLN